MVSLGLDCDERSSTHNCRSDGEVVEGDDDEKNDSLTLTAETTEAVAAVKFIATHLKQEDDFAEVNLHTAYKTSFVLRWFAILWTVDKLGVDSLEFRRLRFDLIFVYKILFGMIQTDVSALL